MDDLEELPRRAPMPKQTILVVTAAFVLVLLLGSGLTRCGGDDSASPSTTQPPTTTTSSSGPETTSTTRPSAPPPGTLKSPETLLALVDRDHGLPDTYVPPNLVEASVNWANSTTDPERRLIRADANHHLVRLFAAAEADGTPLIGISAYRSFVSQQGVHERSIQKNGVAGGVFYTAEAGHSEHQTGLAVDVAGVDGSCITEPCFASTPAGAWVAANAHRFGFVVRYPKGKEDVTGYAYEPWHLRYVGLDLAEELHREQLTLDEYYTDDS